MAEINIILRANQAHVFACPKRFIVVVAGRRWGKTMLGLTLLIAMLYGKPNSLGYYIAPTYRQAKRNVWGILKQLIPPSARLRKSEQELLIELPNNSLLQLHGADHPDSLRGVGLDFAVLDEYSDMDPEMWATVLRPMLADRRGRAVFIGTPKGFDHFYDLFMAARYKQEWAPFHFTTSQTGYVTAEELAAARAEMDPKRYAQEFEASFETLQARVYHAFDRTQNVADVARLPEANLLVGMDFNVNPMCAVVAQKAGDQCQIIDEVVLTNSNTQEMIDELNRRYRGRQGVVHPDPSCAARKTSAPVGQTDLTLLERGGWLVYRPTGSYAVVDRINNVNAMLCNASGVRRLFIAPHCKLLIKALDGLTYKEGTKLPDKTSGLDHITDALGYLISGAFPIVSREVWIGKLEV